MFDIKKAATIITNSNTPILDTIGSQFGVPQCLMDFSKELLGAFPTSFLTDIRDKIQQGKSAAISLVNNTLAQSNLLTNIFQYDDGFGKFVFVSFPSKAGVEADALAGLEDLSFLAEALGFGAQAWLIGQSVVDQVDIITNCINKYKALQSLQNGPSALAHEFANFKITDPLTGEVVDEIFVPPPPTEGDNFAYAELQETLQIASSFNLAFSEQIDNINRIIKARREDPENNPEPCFNGELLLEDGSRLADLNTTFCVIEGATLDENGLWIAPTSGEHVEIISTEDARIGPPVAKSGQYLFSKTGLYYDSYGGGLDYSGCISNIVNAVYFDDDGNPIPGTGVPKKALEFLFEYNPNIGGKGEAVSWETFNKWANTVFNINNINETPDIQEWYNDDQFLQVLIDQRNRESYDLSSIIQDYVTSGLGEDSSLVQNQRQVLYAKVASHDAKIDRRKKQIEVHYTLNPTVEKGHVPINNLEGLDQGLLAVQQSLQESLMFRPNEVSGIVLPLCPTFIKSTVPQDQFTVEDLMVGEVGVGSIINVDKDRADGTSGTVLALNDHITTDKLVAIYNFLDSDLVRPDSNEYKVINYITEQSSDTPAQLVASSVPSLFPSGIGLPYFRGVCNFFSGVSGDGNTKASRYTDNNKYLFSPYRPYGYARLQSGWNDVDSLLYSSNGATIETWVHIPDLNDADGPGWNSSNELSALHRVVLGCENRGGELSSTNDDWVLGPQYGTDTVRGLLMGFSRDRRLTKGAAPSNDPAENELNDGLVFYMAPTQSVNTSGVTFLAASADPGVCPQDAVAGSGFYGLTLDTSTVVSSIKVGDVSSGFGLLTVTVNYGANLVSLYLDGVLMKSQTVKQTFGKEGPPNLPSLVTPSSFSYSNTYEELPFNAPLFPPQSVGQTDFWYYGGPKFDSINNAPPITPWIIGGGFTDGMSSLAPTATGNEGMNFMGGKWGGKKSGLFGFVGSFKLYNKALSSTDVLKNYNAQRGFFKNLKT